MHLQTPLPSLVFCPRHGAQSVFGFDENNDVEQRKTCGMWNVFLLFHETP